jgi:hypothetical protein
MRTTTLALFAALAFAAQANAGDSCHEHGTDHLGAEDLAIMASVLPAPVQAGNTQLAQREPVRVLWSMADPYGRLSAEDISQIQSVQPQGRNVVFCLTNRPRTN